MSAGYDAGSTAGSIATHVRDVSPEEIRERTRMMGAKSNAP